MSLLLDTLLAQLKDPLVRDLAWTIGSPSLLPALAKAPSPAWYQTLLAGYRPRLYQFDRAPEPLYRHCRDCRRLGLYFEHLWLFFLLDDPRFQLLGHNRQQVVDGRTLGAFDFLLWNGPARQVEHWELAVKFYLVTDPADPVGSAAGLNPSDRLRRKLDYMYRHQLRLSLHPQVRPRLEAEGLMPAQTRLLLKGRLFYPMETGPGQQAYWGREAPPAGFEPQQKLDWLTGGRPSREPARRQCYRDDEGNWYARVDEQWLDELETNKK